MTTSERWAAIGELARLAPSPHNTQPFRIRPISDEEAEILLLCDRLLPEEDHGNRYVFSGIGLFARAIELAGAHHGLTAAVPPVPFLDPAAFDLSSPPVVVGRARILGPAPVVPADALLAARRTARMPYRDEAVDPAVIAELTALAAAAGHQLATESDPARVAALLHLNAEAIGDNLQIAPERREIERWYRVGATPVHGDGLWNIPLAQPAWEVKLGFSLPGLFRLPVLKQVAVWKHLRTQVGTRHVALLSGPFSTWPELVDAGRLLMDLWLALTRHGLYLHPFGSTLTNAVYAKRIADFYQRDAGWLLFRFGHADPPPVAPRLASVLA
jgi:hypothetical protein